MAMLDLADFVHLPQLETFLEQLAADGPGLVVVAGLDPRPQAPGVGTPLGGEDRDTFVPSGRTALLGILARQLLSGPAARPAWVVAENKGTIRIPNALRGRVRVEEVRSRPLAGAVTSAVRHGARLVVLERLTPETVGAALGAVEAGVRVLTQLDTVFCGRHVARHLQALGAQPGQLALLTWVVTVQRISMLCNRCKQAVTVDPARMADLRLRYPGITLDGTFYREGACPACHQTGRKGDVALFDVYRANRPGGRPFEEKSLLPMDEYALGLAAEGYVTLDDVVGLDARQLHRTYNLLAASELTLAAANARLTAKLAELDAANRVLQSRTEALISLQKVSHSLITSSDLQRLASSLCQQARQLLNADRAAVYVEHPDHRAEILAVSGWDPQFLHRTVDGAELAAGADISDPFAGPSPFRGWPPGIPERAADVEGVNLRQGLRVALVAEGQIVGWLLVHRGKKAPFSPGQAALLQAFADQSAVAVQRAHLVTDLQDKIERLESAQAELAQKERLEHELELARQVQQSMLPKVFPRVAGYAFAGHCEPARRVGGDFYDVFLLEGDRFGFVIADVSDKGMPAALFMALTRSLLLAEAPREASPRAAIVRVHDLLQRLSPSTMFVTLFYGVIQRSARRLTYVRAGHDRPLLLRSGQVETLPGDGTVIGLLDSKDLYLEENVLALERGDRLLLYTDGVIDALSPSEEPFGLEKLKDLLTVTAAQPLEETCDLIRSRLADHQGTAEQYDDLTLLAVELQ